MAQDAGDPETIAFTLRERYGGHVSAVWPDGKFAIEATTDEVRGMLADARVRLIDGRAGRYYRARGSRAAAGLTSSPEAGSRVWSTGPYRYDGAGNILQIGPNEPWNQTDVYHYDRVGRLVTAQVSAANPAAQPSGAVQWSEAYAYDAFGNMLSKTTTRGIGATPETTTISVDASTNRLSGIYDPNGTSYDAGGNWRGASGVTQTFDAMNRMTSRSVTGAGEEHYIYASGGERVATYWTPSQITRYTLRGPDQKVLREFEKSATGALTWKKDYIWRGGSLLASITDDARTTHYHLDHLGTPRLLTDGSGDPVAMNAYLPFGGEIPDGELDGERHKFTGHERDNLGNGANALDYMHARYYNPNLGRFLSVDPVLGSASTPQSW
ncbi:MAG: RHS repeat-associated core domain-containing protein, partial [Rhodococcus sp. (in: high G+C Gram-positive bacteria)]